MKKVFIFILTVPFFLNAQIKSFKSLSSSLITDDVYGFTEGANGEIYFFDNDDHLFVYRNDSIIKLNFSCSFCNIEDIISEGKDSLLILTKYDGLYRCNKNQAVEVYYIKWYNSIGADNNGVIYIGSTDSGSSNKGLGKSLDKGKTFTFTKQSTNGLPNNIIYKIKTDKANSVWLANWEGIVRLKSGVYKKFADSDLSSTFYSIDISDDEVVWGASAYGGLARVKNESINDYKKYFNPLVSVGGVAVDSKGYAWTYDDKLLRISDADSLQFPMSRFDRKNDIPRALFIDTKDRLWLSLAYDNRPLVIQLDYTSAVMDLKDTGITISPNPATDHIQISSDKYPVSKVELYNVQGQKVVQQVSDINTIDVSMLRAGLYIIKIYSRQGVAVSKVVVE